MKMFSRSPQPYLTLAFDTTGEVLFGAAPGGQNLPVFKVQIQKDEPHLIVCRLPPPGAWTANPSTLGTIRLQRSPSSKIDVSLLGHEFMLKRDLMKSDNHHFEFPSLGRFKWKPDPWGGHSLKLYDDAQRLIAKYKGKSFKKSQIELFVQASDQLVDLVTVTGLGMQLFTIRENEEDDIFFDILENVIGG